MFEAFEVKALDRIAYYDSRDGVWRMRLIAELRPTDLLGQTGGRFVWANYRVRTLAGVEEILGTSWNTLS